MNENTDLARRVETAQFRFGLIAPVVQHTHSEKSDTAYFKKLEEQTLALPDGQSVSYDYKTFQKWAAAYQKNGFDALMPAERSDKGASRKLTDESIAEICRLLAEFPRLNATQIHTRLVENGFIPATVSVCAVQRYIKRHGLRSARNPNLRDRKAFEEDAFGKMYQADTCYLPYITEDGRRRRVYCMGVLDDHSRMIVGAELFYNDNAANFQKVLKDAISAYGIPNKLLVDNGCSYANEQLSLICGSLGIALIHARPRDGATKGKCERQWRTLRERWINGLDTESITSLAQFNQLLREYVRGYNTTVHSGIGCTPLDRYQNTKGSVRVPESREWLEECFLNRVSRKVRKDSTISIDSESYDVPMQFIGAKVEVRYRPGDMTSAFILSDGKHYPIRLTDKVANCHTKRDNSMALDYSKAGDAYV
jgi:transposase InsO family protein